MAFLYNKLNRKLLLSLIIAWGIISFWLINQAIYSKIAISVLALVCFFLIIYEVAPIILLIISSFLVSYSLFGFLFQFGLPLWFVMLIILVIFGYLFVYTEQKIGILGNQRLIYLLLFSIITLEVFLALNYFLISPISKSMIIAAVPYIFIGFCYTVLAKHEDKNFLSYIILFSATILIIFSTSIWGI
jgi:hypothetical protein